MQAETVVEGEAQPRSRCVGNCGVGACRESRPFALPLTLRQRSGSWHAPPCAGAPDAELVVDIPFAWHLPRQPRRAPILGRTPDAGAPARRRSAQHGGTQMSARQPASQNPIADFAPKLVKITDKVLFGDV